IDNTVSSIDTTNQPSAIDVHAVTLGTGDNIEEQIVTLQAFYVFLSLQPIQIDKLVYKMIPGNLIKFTTRQGGQFGFNGIRKSAVDRNDGCKRTFISYGSIEISFFKKLHKVG